MTTASGDDRVVAPLSSMIFRFSEPVEIGPVRILGQPASAEAAQTSSESGHPNEMAAVYGSAAEIMAEGGLPLKALVASPMLGIRDSVRDPTALPFVTPPDVRPESSDIWLAPPAALELLGEADIVDTDVIEALRADRVVGSINQPVGVAYVPWDSIPVEIKANLPSCNGSFIFVPGESGQFQSVSTVRLRSIRVGSGTIDGQTGATVLTQDGELKIAIASAQQQAMADRELVSARIRRPTAGALLAAWLAFGLAAVLTLVPLFVLWSIGGTIGLVAAVLFFGLFYDQVRGEFRNWRRRYNLRRFIVAWSVTVGFGIVIALLSAIHILPALALGILVLIFLLIMIRIWVAAFAAVVGLIFLGVFILITGAARKVSEGWHFVIRTLARWALLGLAATPFGSARSTLQGSIYALPLVSRRLVMTRARLARSGGAVVRMRSRPRGAGAQLAAGEHHHHPHQ
jgi:hypothetical protein